MTSKKARSQAVQNIEVLYVSDMYLACAVRFVSYVEQISEKKFFLTKLSRSSFIYSITQNISFSNFPIIRLTFPINWRIYSQVRHLKSQFVETPNILDQFSLISLWSSKTPQHSSVFPFF